MSLRVIFAGTPDFAAAHLQALLNSQHEVLAVYTQPDRPAGRGQHLKASAVKSLALKNNLAVFQPTSLKDEETQSQLKDLNADVCVVVAYGLILPQAVLNIPRLGCINVHASLLPAWRGAAPIQRAIEAGDQQTGVSIMQMDEGLDTGDILLQKKCSINSTETSEELLQQLAVLGSDALINALNLLEDNKLARTPQDHAKATYAHKITKSEAKLDWNLSAEELVNKVRAFNPWPVAYMDFQHESCRVWRAVALTQQTSQVPGTVLAVDKQGIDIQCGRNVLRILELQRPGKKPQSVAEFVNGKHIIIPA